MDLKTQQYILELDNFKARIAEVDDEEIKSLLVKLFCVRTAGLLEVFIKTRISEYVKGSVPKEISRYLTTKFRDITNLKTSRLQEVLNAFSPDWNDAFSKYLGEHEQQKSSLDSIIAQRHNIAHGQSSNMSLVQMQQYYTDVREIIDYLDTIIRKK